MSMCSTYALLKRSLNIADMVLKSLCIYSSHYGNPSMNSFSLPLIFYPGKKSGTCSLFLLIVFAAIFLRAPGPVAAAESDSATQATVFDLDGRQVLQAEQDLGIINEKLTAGISYQNVGGISGLWSPPFVSSNFSLD